MTTPDSRRWQVLAALTFARTAMGFQFQSIAAVSPFLVKDLAIDNAQLGWLIGLYLLPGIAFALPGGLLAARFGDRRLTLAGLALMAAGAVAIAIADSYAMANLGRIVSGAGAAILNVVLTKMVADAFDPRERVLAMSILINAWPIGIGIALLTAGPVAVALGWRAGVAASALFAAAGWLAVIAVVSPSVAATPESTAGGLGLGVINRSEWRLLATASLPWLLFNAAFQVVVSFMPAVFLQSGSSVAIAGGITGLNTLLVVVSVAAGGVLLRRSRAGGFVCLAAITVWCVSLVAVAQGSSPVAWIVIGGLAAGLPASAFVSLPAEFLRPASRAAGTGVFYTVYYVGCAVLPGIAGVLVDVTGRASSALYLAATMGAASIVTYGIARLEQRRLLGAG